MKYFLAVLGTIHTLYPTSDENNSVPPTNAASTVSDVAVLGVQVVPELPAHQVQQHQIQLKQH